MSTINSPTSIPPPAFDPASRPAMERYVRRQMKLLRNILLWRREAPEEIRELVSRLVGDCLRPVLGSCWDGGGQEMAAKVGDSSGHQSQLTMESGAECSRDGTATGSGHLSGERSHEEILITTCHLLHRNKTFESGCSPSSTSCLPRLTFSLLPLSNARFCSVPPQAVFTNGVLLANAKFPQHSSHSMAGYQPMGILTRSSPLEKRAT